MIIDILIIDVFVDRPTPEWHHLHAVLSVNFLDILQSYIIYNRGWLLPRNNPV